MTVPEIRNKLSSAVPLSFDIPCISSGTWFLHISIWVVIKFWIRIAGFFSFKYFIFYFWCSVVEPEPQVPELFDSAEPDPEPECIPDPVSYPVPDPTWNRTKVKKPNNEVTTFWVTMLLLTLKSQDLVKRKFSWKKCAYKFWILIRTWILSRNRNFFKVRSRNQNK